MVWVNLVVWKNQGPYPVDGEHRVSDVVQSDLAV